MPPWSFLLFYQIQAYFNNILQIKLPCNNQRNPRYYKKAKNAGSVLFFENASCASLSKKPVQIVKPEVSFSVRAGKEAMKEQEKK